MQLLTKRSTEYLIWPRRISTLFCIHRWICLEGASKQNSDAFILRSAEKHSKTRNNTIRGLKVADNLRVTIEVKK